MCFLTRTSIFSLWDHRYYGARDANRYFYLRGVLANCRAFCRAIWVSISSSCNWSCWLTRSQLSSNIACRMAALQSTAHAPSAQVSGYLHTFDLHVMLSWCSFTCSIVCILFVLLRYSSILVLALSTYSEMLSPIALQTNAIYYR